jgi:hypothetical protein
VIPFIEDGNSIRRLEDTATHHRYAFSSDLAEVGAAFTGTGSLRRRRHPRGDLLASFVIPSAGWRVTGVFNFSVRVHDAGFRFQVEAGSLKLW